MEEIRFPIVGEDRGATRVLKDVSRESAVAAAQTRLLAESFDKEKRAAASATDALLKVEKAAALVAITERELEKEAVKADLALKGQSISAAKLGKASKEAAGKNGLAALAGGGGMAGGGMGALITAGAALSPVLVTVGAGLGGIGLAAAGSWKQIKQGSGAFAGLKNEYASFQKTLQPTVIKDFNAAVGAARPILTGITPVAQATGAALAQLLGSVSKELQSGTWKQFFGFMQSTAGPDIQLLGKNFTDLLHTLPPIIEDLQPLAKGLLLVSDDAVRAADHVRNFYDSFQKNVPISNQHTANFLKDLDRDVVSLTDHIPGAKSVNNWLTNVQHNLTGAGGAAARAAPKVHMTVDAVDQAAAAAAYANKVYAQEAHALNVLAGGYTHALGPLENYINAQLAERDDLKAVNQALKASGDRIGFKTQKERDSFAVTQTYIDQTIKTGNAALSAHKGIQGQIDVIEAAIPRLERVKGKTAEYKQELDLLKGILDKLRAEKSIQESVRVTGSGSWSLSRIGAGPLSSKPLAAGGMITGGVAGQDSVPILAMPGEVVVPAKMVAAGLVDHLRGALPGFASGGIVPSYHGSPGGLPGWTSHNQSATITAIGVGIAKAMASSFKSMMMSGAVGDTGARSGNAAVAQAFARSILPAGWSWPALLSLWNQESGWSAYAVNKSSGAYGIPQSLGHGHPYNLGDYKAQIIWGINYIRSRYGSSQAAWAHEVANNWYAEGGMVRGGVPGRDSVLIAAMPGEVVVPTSMVQAGAVDHLKGLIPGFAQGGVVKELRGLSPTTTHLWADIHRILRQIADKYTGSEKRHLDRVVLEQGQDIAQVRRDIRDMKARAKASRQYAASVRQGLSGFADLSNMTLGGGFYGGRQLSGPRVLKRELSSSLGDLRRFGSVLRRLDHHHLPASLLRQIVALGPGPGTQWGEELLSAGPGLLKKISARERDINEAERNIGRFAAHDVFGDTSRKSLDRRFRGEVRDLVHIDQVIVRHPHDIDKLAQKLSHRISASGFGS